MVVIRSFLHSTMQPLQTFHHQEHEASRDETKDDKDSPYNCQRYVIPQETTDTNKQVTDGRSNKPSTHHAPLYFGGATLLTKLIPIGLSNSSPNVRMR